VVIVLLVKGYRLRVHILWSWDALNKAHCQAGVLNWIGSNCLSLVTLDSIKLYPPRFIRLSFFEDTIKKKIMTA
jgi:hypothetical protein